MTSNATPYAVLDTAGKVKAWLDAGRGLRVWTSQEIGPRRPDMLTPGDVTDAPHWAYRGGDRLVAAEDVVFYLKGPVYYNGETHEWSDTPAGWKAAERALARCPADNGNAPLKLQFRYTIERLCYASDAQYDAAHGMRPCGIHYRVAIIQWSAPREDA